MEKHELTGSELDRIIIKFIYNENNADFEFLLNELYDTEAILREVGFDIKIFNEEIIIDDEEIKSCRTWVLDGLSLNARPEKSYFTLDKGEMNDYLLETASEKMKNISLISKYKIKDKKLRWKFNSSFDTGSDSFEAKFNNNMLIFPVQQVNRIKLDDSKNHNIISDINSDIIDEFLEQYEEIMGKKNVAFEEEFNIDDEDDDMMDNPHEDNILNYPEEALEKIIGVKYEYFNCLRRDGEEVQDIKNIFEEILNNTTEIVEKESNEETVEKSVNSDYDEHQLKNSFIFLGIPTKVSMIKSMVNFHFPFLKEEIDNIPASYDDKDVRDFFDIELLNKVVTDEKYTQHLYKNSEDSKDISDTDMLMYDYLLAYIGMVIENVKKLENDK